MCFLYFHYLCKTALLVIPDIGFFLHFSSCTFKHEHLRRPVGTDGIFLSHYVCTFRHEHQKRLVGAYLTSPIINQQLPARHHATAVAAVIDARREHRLVDCLSDNGGFS